MLTNDQEKKLRQMMRDIFGTGTTYTFTEEGYTWRVKNARGAWMIVNRSMQLMMYGPGKTFPVYVTHCGRPEDLSTPLCGENEWNKMMPIERFIQAAHRKVQRCSRCQIALINRVKR